MSHVGLGHVSSHLLRALPIVGLRVLDRRLTEVHGLRWARTLAQAQWPRPHLLYTLGPMHIQILQLSALQPLEAARAANNVKVVMGAALLHPHQICECSGSLIVRIQICTAESRNELEGWMARACTQADFKKSTCS